MWVLVINSRVAATLIGFGQYKVAEVLVCVRENSNLHLPDSQGKVHGQTSCVQRSWCHVYGSVSIRINEGLTILLGGHGGGKCFTISGLLWQDRQRWLADRLCTWCWSYNGSHSWINFVKVLHSEWLNLVKAMWRMGQCVVLALGVGSFEFLCKIIKIVLLGRGIMQLML